MTVKIQYGDYTALINPSRGANCISLRNSRYNAKILREPDLSKKPDNPYLYGMPILYPVNRISGGCFEFEGRTYRFPINEPKTNCHLRGFLHETEFEISKQSGSFAEFVWEGVYFALGKLRIKITYSLSEEGLEQITKITNLSENNMPNFLGFHTTFNVPFIIGSDPDNIRLCAETGEEIERDNNYLPTGKILPCDEINKKINSGTFMPFERVISRNCKSDRNGKIELRDIKHNAKVVYENDKKFGWRLFYNGNADEYICLEPMTCMANRPNAPFERRFGGFDSIPTNTSKEYISKIYLKEMD